MACEPFQTTWDSGLDGEVQPQQALVVSPAAIDFGTVSALGWGRAVQHFTVANAGDEPIAVHGHDEVVVLEGEGLTFEVDASPYFELLPGESRQLNAWFLPGTEGAWAGEVRVNYGLEVLALSGRGVAPVAAVTPPDLPAVPFGCASDGVVEVVNQGSEVLEITDFDLLDDAAWQLDPMAGVEIAPGASLAVPVRFAPPWTGAAGGPRETVLTLETNDPRQPRIPVPLESLVYEGERVTDRFAYNPGLTADLLFVADTDGVMGLYVERAFPALDPLLAALDTGNVDHHAAALTSGGACPASTPAWVSSDTSRYTRARALEAALQGAAGAGGDALVHHAAGALEQEAAGCLSGFLQDDAQLHVVVLAAHADGSGLGPDALLARLAAAAPDSGDIVVSAVIATDSTGCGGATFGAGYAELALDSGGVILDLCQSDWSGGFERLADVSTLAAAGALRRSLEAAPLPETLEVKVDGLTFDGWTWDAADNAVVFAEETAPDAGSAVEITYLTAVDCG